MNNKANSFLKGATILALAGIVSRLIGLFYKVPLYDMVGSYGNGIYGNVTSIYNTLLMISTVGLPVAISKMISESVAIGDYRSAKTIFKISITTLTILGLISSLFLLIGSNYIIELAHWTTDSLPSLLIISLAPLIISICSAYRGYFQGFQEMTPTAVSQIVEQFVRVGLGMFLCYICLETGLGVGKAVGGAIAGATMGGIFALVILMCIYENFNYKNASLFETQGVSSTYSVGHLIKRLVYISIPITLTSSIVSLFATMDSFIYVSRLAEAGISEHTATIMFGDYNNVDTLINIPLVISANLAVAMIPAIAESFALRDQQTMNQKINIAIRLVILIALPCCVGLSILSQGIFDLLFPGSPYGGTMMGVFSYATFFIMLSNIFQSILQSVDKMKIPLINLGVVSIIRIASSWFFLAIPQINIYGLGLSTFLTFFALGVLNYIYVKKYTGVQIEWLNVVGKPLIASIIMGMITWGIYTLVEMILGNFMAIVFSVMVGMVVYGFVMIFIGGIGEDELSALPASGRIRPIFNKITKMRNKIWRKK